MKVERSRLNVTLIAEDQYEEEALRDILRYGIERASQDPDLAWGRGREHERLVLSLRDPDKWV